MIRVDPANDESTATQPTRTPARADLPRVTLEGLRHTHARLLLELGEQPKAVQDRLGHSTITTTMNIYSHVAPTLQQAAVNRFAAHLDGA